MRKYRSRTIRQDCLRMRRQSQRCAAADSSSRGFLLSPLKRSKPSPMPNAEKAYLCTSHTFKIIESFNHFGRKVHLAFCRHLIDRVTLTLSYGNDDHHSLVIADFIHYAVADMAEFDFVSILLA